MVKPVEGLSLFSEEKKEKTYLKFNHKDKSGFYPEVRRRVNQYFSDRKISKHYNHKMIFKTVLILSMYLLL